MRRVTPAGKSERGAILVHAAFALLALTVLTTFVADFGVVWLSRSQIQNAADAGAMAGAIALTYDTPAAADSHARAVVQENLVFGQPSLPDVNPGDGACPPGTQFPDNCVRVDAYRDAAHGNPLPLLFGGLVGLSAPGVRAVAVAPSRPASFTNCLRPGAIVDRWNEQGSPPFVGFSQGSISGPMSTFDAYNTPPQPDTSLPPSTTSPGTGFAVPLDYGRRIAVRVNQNLQPARPIGPTQGWTRVFQLPAVGTHAAHVSDCAGVPMTSAPIGGVVCPPSITIGTEAFWAARGCYRWRDGDFVNDAQLGVGTLVSQDSGAYWDPGLNGGAGGVANSCCGPSPRLVTVGVLDLNHLLTTNVNGFSSVVRLSNIIGFFVEGMGTVDPATGVISCCSGGGNAVVGRVMRAPGQVDPTVPIIDDDAAFLRAVLLVR